MSRLTAGRLVLNFDEVDLAALAREVAQRFTPDATAASCVMKIDLPSRWSGCGTRRASIRSSPT